MNENLNLISKLEYIDNESPNGCFGQHYFSNSIISEDLKCDPNLENIYMNEDIVSVKLEGNNSLENLIQDDGPYLDETLEEAKAIIEKNNLELVNLDVNVESGKYEVNYNDPQLIIANFPYLESPNLDNNNIFLPTSDMQYINGEITLQDCSALTLLNFHGNLILATDNIFFYQQ
jgi:hypothetical protein